MESEGLNEYLKIVKNIEECLLREVIIDQCNMSDEILE